jgi:hypothetical protein
MITDQRRALTPADTLTQTVGCRHSNPNICKNNMTERKCAFTRADNICFLPPRSWGRIFLELQRGEIPQRAPSS